MPIQLSRCYIPCCTEHFVISGFMYITMQLLYVLGQKHQNVFANVCNAFSLNICIEKQSSLNGCLLNTFIETTEHSCLHKCSTLADCWSASFSQNGSCKIYRAPNAGENCNVISDLASNYYKFKDGI